MVGDRCPEPPEAEWFWFGDWTDQPVRLPGGIARTGVRSRFL
jgi:hypothetical protein